MDGVCWPTVLPQIGTTPSGQTCSVDNDCDRGFCNQQTGTCTSTCVRDSDCSSGSFEGS